MIAGIFLFHKQLSYSLNTAYFIAYFTLYYEKETHFDKKITKFALLLFPIASEIAHISLNYTITLYKV